jgi:hydrogenase maturation protein HypF
MNRAAATLRIKGTVQGVGFRPFVYRLARELGLAGWVRNEPAGVSIHVEGSAAGLPRFCDSIRALAPANARIEGIAVEAAEPSGLDSFRIEGSLAESRLTVRVPRDVATCDACRDEVDEIHNRRRGYAFTTCTGCGPRYSIITALPYDRAATAMNRFALCPSCQDECSHPADRRFHSQTNACPTCGPQLALQDPSARTLFRGEAAIHASSQALRGGRIVALKGVGGFQLVVRADDSEAVARLRRLKRRPVKPLAVMVASLHDAHRLARLGREEVGLLTAPENPIVVVARRAGETLSCEVAPGLQEVGILLPTTPLHHLLLARLDGIPLVVTSGNRGEEPIALDESTAFERLAGIADLFLVHDRPIVRRVDDSVTRVIDGRAVTIRLARGLAPHPLASIERLALSLDRAEHLPWLAVGGHQKVAVALWTGTQAVLSQHIGDMDGAENRAAFCDAVDDICRLYTTEPAGLACDIHPDYFTTRWAEERGVRLVRVQHHHAHAVAAMADHDLLDREVLALTWDGTGYGTDGTIWGGEILVARLDRFERIASLLPLPLPGGERAIRQPRRIALGALAMALGDQAILGNARWLQRLRLTDREAELIVEMVRRGIQTTWSSSIGRLFDAVSAIVLGVVEASYEGEGAAMLEAAVDRAVTGAYPIRRISPRELDGMPGGSGTERGDWRPMIEAIHADIEDGVPAGVISARFHNSLACWAAIVVANHAPREVVVGGGCFQNRYLVEAVEREVRRRASRRVLGPGTIPPGDGGLAVGQLAIALARAARPRDSFRASSQAAGVRSLA